MIGITTRLAIYSSSSFSYSYVAIIPQTFSIEVYFYSAIASLKYRDLVIIMK